MFEQVVGEEMKSSLQACEDKWNGISPKLKVVQPNSLLGLKRAIFRGEQVTNTLRTMQLKWNGLCFSPPLLVPIHLVEDIDEDLERKN